MAALNRGGFEVGMVVWSLEDLNKTDPDGFERSDFDSPEALDHPALVIRVRGPPVTDKDKGGILICTISTKHHSFYRNIALASNNNNSVQPQGCIRFRLRFVKSDPFLPEMSYLNSRQVHEVSPSMLRPLQNDGRHFCLPDCLLDDRSMHIVRTETKRAVDEFFEKRKMEAAESRPMPQLSKRVVKVASKHVDHRKTETLETSTPPVIFGVQILQGIVRLIPESRVAKDAQTGGKSTVKRCWDVLSTAGSVVVDVVPVIWDKASSRAEHWRQRWWESSFGRPGSQITQERPELTS